MTTTTCKNCGTAMKTDRRVYCHRCTLTLQERPTAEEIEAGKREVQQSGESWWWYRERERQSEKLERELYLHEREEERDDED